MDEPQPEPAVRREQRAPLRNRRFLLAIFLILLGAAVWIAWPYRAAIVLALVLGYVLRPVYLRVLKGVRWKPVAAGVVLLLVAAALVAPLAFIGWSIVDEIAGIREAIRNDGYRERLVDFLGTLGIEREAASTFISDAFSAAAGFLQTLVVDAVSGALDLVLGLVVFFILLYFTLVGGEGMVSAFHEYAPISTKRRERLLQQTGERVRAILLGTFFVSGLQGVVGGLGWWIFGFPAPLFWGFVMTILGVLPFVGPQLVTIPAAILAIAQGDYVGGVGLLIWTLVAVSLIDDLVRPYVIGKQAGVHPALILIGTLGGIKVMGLSGIILGPLVLGLLEPILRTWRNASGPPPEADGPREEPAPVRRSLYGRLRRAS